MKGLSICATARYYKRLLDFMSRRLLVSLKVPAFQFGSKFRVEFTGLTVADDFEEFGRVDIRGVSACFRSV